MGRLQRQVRQVQRVQPREQADEAADDRDVGQDQNRRPEGRHDPGLLHEAAVPAHHLRDQEDDALAQEEADGRPNQGADKAGGAAREQPTDQPQHRGNDRRQTDAHDQAVLRSPRHFRSESLDTRLGHRGDPGIHHVLETGL